MPQVMTIPGVEPTNDLHGVGTVVGICVDENGSVINRFEKPPKSEITVSDSVDTIQILNDRSELSNNPVSYKYKTPVEWENKTLSEVKSEKIQEIKDRAHAVLSETDWYIAREQETEEAIPQDILDHRSQVRADSDTFEQDVNDLTTVEDVLKYEYSFPDPPEL